MEWIPRGDAQVDRGSSPLELVDVSDMVELSHEEPCIQFY
jgi:hypothetical protein